jgi:hypothetical protein
MCTEKSKRFSRQLSRGARALAIVAIGMHGSAALAQGVSAVQPAVASQPGVVHIAQLEKGFWTCDYIATTHGVHAAPVATCSAITDELKNQKFGGDFAELLEWWRANKRAEHQKLQAN